MEQKWSMRFRRAVTLLFLLGIALVLCVLSSDRIHGRWAYPKSILVNGSLVPVNDALRLNTYSENDFALGEDGRMRCLNGPFRTGVDVSLYQGTIDWDQVASDGIDFAMVRAGSRSFSTGELRQDKMFVSNVQGAAAAGLDVGVYFFSQAISPEEAEEEAAFLVELLQDLPLTLPVVYDWEQVEAELDTNGVSRTLDVDGKTVTACALAFFRRLEEAGFQGMLYCNSETGYFTYDLAQLQDYPIWYASYSTLWPNFYYGVDLWQYTDSGQVQGIPEKVDLNLLPIETDPMDRPSVLPVGSEAASAASAEAASPSGQSNSGEDGSSAASGSSGFTAPPATA